MRFCERLVSEQDKRAGKRYTSARRISWLYIESDRIAVHKSGSPCANTPGSVDIRNHATGTRWVYQAYRYRQIEVEPRVRFGSCKLTSASH